jgi:hypothetical protein
MLGPKVTAMVCVPGPGPYLIRIYPDPEGIRPTIIKGGSGPRGRLSYEKMTL